jgi:flagellar biosynthesis component FlhA
MDSYVIMSNELFSILLSETDIDVLINKHRNKMKNLINGLISYVKSSGGDISDLLEDLLISSVGVAEENSMDPLDLRERLLKVFILFGIAAGYEQEIREAIHEREMTTVLPALSDKDPVSKAINAYLWNDPQYFLKHVWVMRVNQNDASIPVYSEEDIKTVLQYIDLIKKDTACEIDDDVLY